MRSYGVGKVIDGDTIVLDNGEKVRLLGIDAPDKGIEGSEKTTVVLETLIGGKKVWVEGDRYKEDQYGRRLGWLWMNCESVPEFKPEKYMEKVYLRNRGNTYTKWVEENPIGCRGGILVNEQLLKMGVVEQYFVEGEGELKYGERLRRAMTE